MWLTAKNSIQRLPIITMAFVVCQGSLLYNSRLILVRAMHAFTVLPLVGYFVFKFYVLESYVDVI